MGSDGNTGNSGGVDDTIGKLPLAIQQLALAKMRAEESGDSALAKILGDKMNELIKNISV